MTEPLIRSPATDANGRLGLGLHLVERMLEICETADCDSAPVFGERMTDGAVTRLRHWPDRVWHVAETGDDLPEGTDIGHGIAVLCLRGPGALRFLADYCTADLRSAAIRRSGTVRTRLGQYTVLMWWNLTRDIHIATERSHAQSLADHLRALANRREPHEHLD